MPDIFGFLLSWKHDNLVYFLWLLVVLWSSEYLFPDTHFNIPPVCGVHFHSDYIQRVPGRDGQSVVQTQHTYHHGFAGAKPKKETANPRKHHRATCQWSRQKAGMFPLILVEQRPLSLQDLTATQIPRGSCRLGLAKLRCRFAHLDERFAPLTAFWTQQAWNAHHQLFSYLSGKVYISHT